MSKSTRQAPGKATTDTRAVGREQEPRLSTEQIHDELRDRIALLRYDPGEMLGEVALAEEFGVSRTPIRQALQRLEYEGLVVTRRGIGTMVATIDLPYLRSVYALRLKLIDVIGDLSPRHVDDAALGPLTEILRAVEDMAADEAPDLRSLARLYIDFNRELSRAIGNEPLREIAERLFFQTSRVWLQLAPHLDPRGEVVQVIDEVGRVRSALAAGDMHEVAAVRREHMIGLLQRMNNFLGAQMPAGNAGDGAKKAKEEVR